MDWAIELGGSSSKDVLKGRKLMVGNIGNLVLLVKDNFDVHSVENIVLTRFERLIRPFDCYVASMAVSLFKPLDKPKQGMSFMNYSDYEDSCWRTQENQKSDPFFTNIPYEESISIPPVPYSEGITVCPLKKQLDIVPILFEGTAHVGSEEILPALREKGTSFEWWFGNVYLRKLT